MLDTFDGNAIIYCEGFFNTTNGKTAHGLVRRTRRYRVLGLIDSGLAGRDAGEVLDGKKNGIQIYGSLDEAFTKSKDGESAIYFINGITPDGGRISETTRKAATRALELGLNVDSGAHDFLSEDPKLVKLAKERAVTIRDVRKPPPRDELHFFSGKIEEVKALKVALLGTDSAVGKRTTAWMLTDALNDDGIKTAMVGTGQTSWMQGAKYCVVMDSLVNDFVAGEIEHAVWSAWSEEGPDVIIIEGQGSLMNPAYPGGFEILAAGRPDVVIMQHPPVRKEYDGFPGYALHPLDVQIKAVEFISGKPVIAIAINHEGIALSEIPGTAADLERETGLPAADVLVQGAGKLVEALRPRLKRD
jgi:uncharacterized NAD-dependent epimerase/dehydratase family protein